MLLAKRVRVEARGERVKRNRGKALAESLHKPIKARTAE
jgi:hypothetical protein